MTPMMISLIAFLGVSAMVGLVAFVLYVMYARGVFEQTQRLTLVADRGRIVKVFYPVFPPDENAGDVLAWLRSRE